MHMWYVIQVIKGCEDAMASLIGRVVPQTVLAECFSPKFATEIKLRGQWTPCAKNLFPGYLIAVTDSPVELESRLAQLHEFAHVLMQGESYAPLAPEDMEIIGAFTRPGERVIPMSMGVKDGERVMVTEGPLVGHEGKIRSIDRHKSTAVVEFDLCGRFVTARMGLGLVTADERVMEDIRAHA